MAPAQAAGHLVPGSRGDAQATVIMNPKGLQPLGDAVAAWGLPAIDASGVLPSVKGLTLDSVNIWRILKTDVYRVKHKRLFSNSIKS